MNVKAAEIAARMKATAAGSRPEAKLRPSTENHPSSSAVHAPTAEKRFTVILPKAQHRFIKRFALESDSDASTIIRTLLAMPEADPSVAEKVRALIHENQ